MLLLYDVVRDCGHDTANLRTDDRKKGPDGDGDGNGSAKCYNRHFQKQRSGQLVITLISC